MRNNELAPCGHCGKGKLFKRPSNTCSHCDRRVCRRCHVDPLAVCPVKWSSEAIRDLATIEAEETEEEA